jgi:hypothetical protein
MYKYHFTTTYVQKVKPSLIFLSYTHNSKNKMKKLIIAVVLVVSMTGLHKRKIGLAEMENLP